MSTADRVISTRSDSIFFPSMAIAMAFTVFAGFSRTYYLRGVFHPPLVLTELMIVHGLAFTAWIGILVTQTGLVAADRRDLHVKLGVLGITLAPVMVGLGTALAIYGLRHAHMPHGAPSPAAFFAIPMEAITAFAALVVWGIANRARPDWHKRFMLLSTVAILPAAVARLPLGFVEHGGPPVFFALTDLFVVALAIYDFRTKGRLHPATLRGGGLVVLAQPLCLIIGMSGPWAAFAGWLVG